MNIVDYITRLYKEKNQLVLLNWAYGVLAVASVVLAGLCALVDQAFGVGMLIIPLVSLVALCMNVVAWSLVQSGIESLVKKQKKQQSRSAKTKKTNGRRK